MPHAHGAFQTARAATYTAVTTSLAVIASDIYKKYQLGGRWYKLNLEQAATIMAEVAETCVTDRLYNEDLLVMVPDVRKKMNSTGKLLGLFRLCSTKPLLEEYWAKLKAGLHKVYKCRNHSNATLLPK